MTEELTLSRLQEQVDAWIKTLGVRYFDPLTNMAILTEEVGEVARIMARKYGEQQPKPGEETLNLEDELADVIWVVACIANQTGCNLTEAIQKNFLKKAQRDKTRHINNPKLNNTNN